MAVPNLPYIVDGDVAISETLAVIRYICETRAPWLLGEGLRARARQDSLLHRCFFDNTNLRSLCYGFVVGTGFTRPNRSREFPLRFQVEGFDAAGFARSRAAVMLEEVTEQGFLIGPRHSAADLFLYEHLALCRCVDPSLEEALPAARAFRERIEAIPEVRAYRSGPDWIEWPLNAFFAPLNNVPPDAAARPEGGGGMPFKAFPVAMWSVGLRAWGFGLRVWGLRVRVGPLLAWMWRLLGKSGGAA
mmetsp:Transcript_36006/g.72636  ORF Transcript_36006/g.72636 Transcript_36006/m.72636 type:complete len:246 (+) Transcript_36006:288-1025(+)